MSKIGYTPGVPFAGGAGSIDDSPAVTLVAAESEGKGIPIVTQVMIDSGTTASDIVSIRTGTTVKFKARGRRTYSDLFLVGAAGETVNAVGQSSGASVAFASGYHIRGPVPSKGTPLSGTATEETADGGSVYATLYDTGAAEDVIIHRAIVENVDSTVAALCYADDATGTNAVVIAATVSSLDLHGLGIVVPTGKKILLRNTESVGGGAKAVFGYFHGQLMR